MGDILGHLEPKGIFNQFEEITRYPRPSKKEEKIAAYVVSVAEKNNLEYVKDAFGNIIIKKPATPGYENRETIVLQSHIDMVCESNRGVEHDFDNDPINIYIDGDWIKAKGTTLGADNGIGMAAALAVLEDKTLEHGPVECLFTLDEETGLTGASSLDTTVLKGGILLNLDSEEEGTVFIGCSGGKNTEAEFTAALAPAPAGSVAFNVKVIGLTGGHSGLEIHSGFANAVKLMTRLLWSYGRNNTIALSSIEGGNKHNAIPREAFATVVVPASDKDKFSNFVAEYNKTVTEENSSIEKNLSVTADETAVPASVIDAATQAKLLGALYAVPHGVIKMSPDIAGLVETSTNLATIATKGNVISIVTSQRSSVASENVDVTNMVTSVFELAGAKVSYGDGYPGWKPNIHSPVLTVLKKCYHDLFNKECEVKAIHAGLECGIIGEKYPAMDMISFGPTMFGVHSPDERLNIPSVKPFWELLVSVLKNAPVK